MSAPKSFQMAAKSTTEERDREYKPRDYVFVSATEFEPLTEKEVEDGVAPYERRKTTVVAHYPGDGVMTLMIASMATDAEQADALGSIFSILEAAFSDQDYRFLRKKLRDEEIDSELLMQMIEDMMDAWLAFPTQPSSGSASRQPSTGTRSTGRVRAGA